MPAVLILSALSGGDSVNVFVAEDYEDAVQRLQSAGDRLVAFTNDRGGAQIAVNPRHVVMVRPPRN